MLDDGERALFTLHVEAPQVLADDAEQHGVDADGGEDEGGERSEAGGPLLFEEQPGDDIAGQPEQGEGGDDEAEVGGDAERDGGVIEDAVKGERKELRGDRGWRLRSLSGAR